MRRRAFIGTTAALSVPLVAGCADGGGGPVGGGGSGPYGGGASGGGGGETTTGGTTDGRSGQSSYPDYDWEVLTRADAATTTSVTMRNTAFQPLIARVDAGAEVTFTNEDAGPHTVTVPALDVDERLSGGASTAVTFEAPGAYDYVCTLHPPAMLGRVVVE